MNFEVIWNPTALSELAAIWLAVTDQPAVTRASDSIERALARDPLNLGESRPGTQRVAYEFPLGIRYEVVLDDRRVIVVGVWLSRAV